MKVGVRRNGPLTKIVLLLKMFLFNISEGCDYAFFSLLLFSSAVRSLKLSGFFLNLYVKSGSQKLVRDLTAFFSTFCFACAPDIVRFCALWCLINATAARRNWGYSCSTVLPTRSKYTYNLYILITLIYLIYNKVLFFGLLFSPSLNSSLKASEHFWLSGITSRLETPQVRTRPRRSSFY